MNQEDKELLLKDLCARLPYGVKCNISRKNETCVKSHTKDSILDCHWLSECKSDFYEIKPYLFPLSSMTEEQEEEYGKHYDIDLANSTKNLYDRLDGKKVINGYPMYNHVDWLNKNHFDYRGLIPMGLANDATGLNIY